MDGADKRKHERVDTSVKVKLPGDTIWTECATSNVSAGGLFFQTAKQLIVGDFVTLQFMLQAKVGTFANVHFFASAKVVRTTPKDDAFQIAVEFIVDEDVRKEIQKLVEMIKSQNLKVDRPTAIDAVLHKLKPSE
jgi:Tfp pilus assembly protein PilZ